MCVSTAAGFGADRQVRFAAVRAVARAVAARALRATLRRIVDQTAGDQATLRVQAVQIVAEAAVRVDRRRGDRR